MNIGYFNARGINDVEHWFRLEIEELRRRGHDVRVFTANPKFGASPTRDDIRWMDIAHYHFAQVADRFKRMGVPFVVSPHANDIFTDNGRILLRVSNHPKCKCVTYQSFYHKKKFEEWGIDKPLVYLPMCCRTETFFRKAPYDPGGNAVAGGRLIPKKGLDKLKDVENLTIFGDGSLWTHLQQILLGADFKGWLNESALRDLFEESSVYLFPAVVTSDGDSDGIPNTLKEAMLMELPCIASPVAGIPELKNITLCEDWDNIPDIKREANKKGRKEILDIYSPDKCVDRILEIIDKYV